MNNKVEKNIQNNYDFEENNPIEEYCPKCFFQKAKENCITLFQKLDLANKSQSQQTQKKLIRQIQTHCKVYKNYKKIYITLLYNQVHIACENQKEDKEGCITYVLEKLLNISTAFDFEQESSVFKTVKLKLKELEELYREIDGKELNEIVPKLFLDNEKLDTEEFNSKYSKKDSIGAINNYIRKVTKYYQNEKFNKESREAIIDNAIHHLENNEMKNYFQTKLFNYKKEYTEWVEPKCTIERELLLFLTHEEISYILSSILNQFLHKERFFNYITKYIHLRTIDFYRKKSPPSELKVKKNKIRKILKRVIWSIERPDKILLYYQYYIQELSLNVEEVTVKMTKQTYHEESYNDNEIQIAFESIKKLTSNAEQIILFLYYGIYPTKKVKEVIFNSFTANDIFNIKSHVRGLEEISTTTKKKIEKLKSILFDEMIENNSIVAKELRYDRVNLIPEVLEKICTKPKPTPLTYKEISELFGKEPKWASRKKDKCLKRLKGLNNDKF